MTANTDVVRVKLADATDAPAESDTCETILEFINSLDATTFNYGFYSDWEPMSYANHRTDASDPGFNEPNGYEPDMIRAIEKLAGGKVTFNAYGVGPAFSGIWYKAATDDFDFIGGGIAQLDARTVNEAGKQIVMYGTTNAVLRQSLLVPSDSTLESYDDLTSEHTVGPHKGTTGEGRMLVLTGISDADGYLRSGTVVTMYDGSKFTTDGTQYITSGLASPELAERASLIAPGDDVPGVIYFHSEADQLTAVMGGDIDAIPGVDAIPRGEIGNIIAAAASEGALKVVGFDDSNIEAMGFYYPNTDEGYATMEIMDRLVNFITADQTIMFNEYYNDETVFMARAESCSATEEPTDGGDDECACDMSGYVSMEDFDALRAEVRELTGSLGSVEADNNDVMNAMEEMATCMSGIVDGFSGEEYDTEEPMTEAPETTRMRSTTTTTTTTTTMEPTKMPSMYPTMRMTEKWETMARMAEGANKCGTASDERAFRLTFTSLDNCVDRCYGDSRCNFASTDEENWCIGCIVLDKTSDGWTAYEMMRGRRQLSEVEALRRENAALKAELARVRRN